MLSAAELLAVNNFGDTRSGGLAGPMGLFIILLMAIATVLLIRNMNARLRRLPREFPDPDRPDATDAAADGGRRDAATDEEHQTRSGSDQDASDVVGLTDENGDRA
jgi:hypothetical protein